MSWSVVWYSFRWKVIHGKKLGRTIWVPTANVSLVTDDISDWVYACNIVYDGQILSWVWTYLKQKELFEVYIFDFKEDIYWETLEVIILEKIRDNQKFDSLDDLKLQIYKDIEYAKHLDYVWLTFGSFDILHQGHQYYLSEAKKYSKSLITIIARDETIERIKWKKPYFSEEKRVDEVQKLWLSEVYLWDRENPFIWLEKFKPKVILLGYDQRGRFIEALPSKLQELWLSDTKIMRIGSLKPEKYKSSLLRKQIT